MIKLNIALFSAGMGDSVLPELLRRPVTLIRCSTGRMEECFYQRHGFSGLPQCGAVKFHPWECRIEDLEHSDRMTLDLDPGEAADCATLAAAAEHLRERLAGLDLTAFLCTTGGAGLHLVIRLDQAAAWERVKLFLKALARDAPRLFIGKKTSFNQRHKDTMNWVQASCCDLEWGEID